MEIHITQTNKNLHFHSICWYLTRHANISSIILLSKASIIIRLKDGTDSAVFTFTRHIPSKVKLKTASGMPKTSGCM